MLIDLNHSARSTTWVLPCVPKALVHHAGVPEAAAMLAAAPALPGALLALAAAAAGFGAGRWGGAPQADPGASPTWPANAADWDAAAAADPVQGLAVDPASLAAYPACEAGSGNARLAAGEPAGAAAELGIPPPEQVRLTGAGAAVELAHACRARPAILSHMGSAMLTFWEALYCGHANPACA